MRPRRRRPPFFWQSGEISSEISSTWVSSTPVRESGASRSAMCRDHPSKPAEETSQCGGSHSEHSTHEEYELLDCEGVDTRPFIARTGPLR